MWKSQPVVASAIGGIQDQIVDGESGVLLENPMDLEALADALATVLEDDALAARLGAGAHKRVLDRFLPDRHLAQYVDLFERGQPMTTPDLGADVAPAAADSLFGVGTSHRRRRTVRQLFR